MKKTTKHSTKSVTLTDKLVETIRKFGISERKAREMAKKLAITARRAVKMEIAPLDTNPRAKKKRATAELPGKEQAESTDDGGLRLDLPILDFRGAKGQELDTMRVMHGLTSSASYIVAAVKGENGAIAIRRFNTYRQDGESDYNVKFYPTMEFWGETQERMEGLGAHSFLHREWYERMHFPKVGVEQLLERIQAASKPQSRMKKLVERLKAVTITPLTAGFNRLYNAGVASLSA